MRLTLSWYSGKYPCPEHFISIEEMKFGDSLLSFRSCEKEGNFSYTKNSVSRLIDVLNSGSSDIIEIK